ncbi:hypothetical protein I79_012717 [Cricetulus griseus]|uniref:Uncharacterized protein n=1 Tax=Cricetulus griseus TaxID=10029 RepID=G3HPK3_CRIGR|nr:hypothetical protein I79_012717 [Cricetulus griseus]
MVPSCWLCLLSIQLLLGLLLVAFIFLNFTVKFKCGTLFMFSVTPDILTWF